MAKEFKYDIDEEFGDHIIEERGNTSFIMRKIAWGGGDEYKLDIRKYLYTDEGERMGKGISLPDTAANNLVPEMIKCGYGDTKEIIDILRSRDDFDESLDKSLNGVSDISESDEYYDPKELLNKVA